MVVVVVVVVVVLSQYRTPDARGAECYLNITHCTWTQYLLFQVHKKTKLLKKDFVEEFSTL